MEDQDSILNEFLEKIKNLEKSNESLKQKISQKKSEISKMSTDLSKSDNKEPNKITINTKKPTEKDGETFALKALANYKSIKLNQNNIKQNCAEYIIEYRSQEQHNSIYIMGDFTKWELCPMKKAKDSFTYKVILLKGFKYYYVFQAGDQILLDYNAPFEENPKTLQVQNYINLNEVNKDYIFDSENDINILKITEQNYRLAQLDLNEDDFVFLNKLKYHNTKSKEINKEIRDKKEKLISSINSYFHEILKYVNPFSNLNHVNKFRIYLKNKILAHYIENKIYYFRILSITESNIFQCVKLYDNNHIKININSYSYSGFYYNVLSSQITSKKIEPSSKLYHLLSLEESQKILDEYNKDEKNILTAYFKSLLNLKNNSGNNEQNNESIYDFRRKIIFVTPIKVEPEGINKDDYDFYYSQNKITRVKNKKEGSEVIFKIIDQSVEKSKRPNRYEIYYGINNDKINLIHCHVLDKELRNTKMIIKEIKPNEDPHILKKSEEYIKNNQLLLITQGQNILKLYYQGKKVKMVAIKIEKDKLYFLQSSNPDSIFNKMYVTVQNFSEKLNFDLIEQCNEFTYSLDNMLNGVDVQVTFDPEKNYVIEPMMLSVSPCLLKPVSHYDEHILKEKMPKKEDKNKNKNDEMNNFNMMTEMDKYFTIAQRMVALRKYKNKENMDKMTQEEKNKIIKELDEYSKAMELILIYIETNEMWENIEEAMSISAEVNELKNIIEKNK